ncbi:MAG: hypothetical protein ACRDGI_01030 [Candidatus Limnocylindrales bacterium]
MTDGSSFRGAATSRGRRDGPVVAAVLLVVLGIAVAIAKPWGGPSRPLGSPKTGVAVVSPSAPSTSGPPNPAPTQMAHPLLVAFSAPVAPVSSVWAGLTWRRLAPDDPLGIVRAEVSAQGTSVAIGDIAGSTSTGVWSSPDGSHWQPLQSGTSSTFWPNLSILSLATVRERFVAVSAMNDYLLRDLPPIIAWASSDGRSWTPASTLPVDPLSSPTGSTTLVAAGPNGLLVATAGLGVRVASSSDGSHWVLSPPGPLPAGFALYDLEGSATGYVAVGAWAKGAGPARAATLWSADGRHWPKVPTLLPGVVSGSGSAVVSNAVSLVVGDDGMVAAGIGGYPGGTLWWRSADGQHWQALKDFPPLGATTCGGTSCGPKPNGTLVGDGHRLVAIRGGTGGAGWVSSDGQHWAALNFSGDLPDAQATQATLLPGGVLLSDGTTTWFGQAGER